ncbi:MAG TPA: hypothetical protein VHJ20_24760 [Polyangia bacterium]|nr:hypothetical protein [Polyangia bacterium]
MHVPLWHVSAPSHTVPFAHDVPFVLFVWLTPLTGSHASVVHGFPSSTVSGVPDVHVPLWHVSAPSHTVPFAHDVPFVLFVWLTPLTGSHASVVHGFPSSTTSGVPDVHAPLWHVSAPSHTVEFAHDVPFVTAGQAINTTSHVVTWHASEPEHVVEPHVRHTLSS